MFMPRWFWRRRKSQKKTDLSPRLIALGITEKEIQNAREHFDTVFPSLAGSGLKEQYIQIRYFQDIHYEKRKLQLQLLLTEISMTTDRQYERVAAEGLIADLENELQRERDSEKKK